MFKAKVAAYAERLEPMNRQRLYPEFPNWPCLCFYPMSKMRTGDQNWYLLPFETRAELMSQHGRSGMKFAGRVSQVITASTGLDNWEWGVTLWARNPSYLKDIVYTMRFDESSAKYALFGDFYFGYILPPDELSGNDPSVNSPGRLACNGKPIALTTDLAIGVSLDEVTHAWFRTGPNRRPSARRSPRARESDPAAAD